MYLTLGFVCVALGFAGVVLPLLPTTPFLLLAAAAFLKSSPRWHRWLLQHRTFGPYLRNFLLHKAIPLKVKVVSVSLVWITLSYCAVFLTELLVLRLLFLLLATGITVHILSYRTLR